jgi:GTP cyclohydrolase II
MKLNRLLSSVRTPGAGAAVYFRHDGQILAERAKFSAYIMPRED